jgi:hypothetical protein
MAAAPRIDGHTADELGAVGIHERQGPVDILRCTEQGKRATAADDHPIETDLLVGHHVVPGADHAYDGDDDLARQTYALIAGQLGAAVG